MFDELDKYKTNTDKKNTKRVKNILSKIEKEYQKDNSLILVNLSTPKDKTYEKFELSKNQPDHALLAAILEFEDQHENDGVILISNDTGARIRARSLDISLVELDEEFLLPKGDSTEEKESKKLRKQLEELKNMLPQVELNFDDGKLFKKVELNPLLQTEKDYLETELILLKKTHSPFIIENQTNDTYTQKPIMLDDLLNSHKWIDSLSVLPQPSTKRKEEYNKELEKFYATYTNMLREKYQWNKILSNSVLLNLNISNNGTAPATDIDVYIVFPKSVRIVMYKDFPKFVEPKPPFKPKYHGDIDTSMIRSMQVFSTLTENFSYFMDKSIINNTWKHLKITTLEDGSTSIHYKYPNSLKHNLRLSLEPIWVVSTKSFQIIYKLLVSNYPKLIEGELNVEVIV